MSYIWKHIICIIILYHPLSTSQSEWIAVIPSSLISGNSSKHSCWLWTHDVSCLYPSALQGYPTHFIVMYMYQPHHLGAAIYQSEVISNEDIYFGCVCFLLYRCMKLNDAPPYQSIGWIPSCNKIIYPILLYSTNVYEPLGHMHCCKLFILYICLFNFVVGNIMH